MRAGEKTSTWGKDESPRWALRGLTPRPTPKAGIEIGTNGDNRSPDSPCPTKSADLRRARSPTPSARSSTAGSPCPAPRRQGTSVSATLKLSGESLSPPLSRQGMNTLFVR